MAMYKCYASFMACAIKPFSGRIQKPCHAHQVPSLLRCDRSAWGGPFQNAKNIFLDDNQFRISAPWVYSFLCLTILATCWKLGRINQSHKWIVISHKIILCQLATDSVFIRFQNYIKRPCDVRESVLFTVFFLLEKKLLLELHCREMKGKLYKRVSLFKHYHFLQEEM